MPAAVIAIEPDGDKVTRLYANQPKFEQAPLSYLARRLSLAVILELRAFPHYRHDDQVDSISPALTWIKRRPRPSPSGSPVASPNHGGIHLSEGFRLGWEHD